MQEKDGKEFERLIELIERSISSDSRVERDVFLPVLHSASGRTAQCDVVIRSGYPPRETLTLVEVQDRSKRVEINDFRGWVKKLSDVGAQHLICVSMHPFPLSIKEDAATMGETVRLVTVKRLEVEEIPFSAFNFSFNLDRFALKNINDFVVGVSSDCEELAREISGIDSRFAHGFSFDGQTTMSFGDLCGLLLKNEGYETSGRAVYQKPPEDDPILYYKIGDQFVKIGVIIDFEWEIERLEIPMGAVLSYEQLNHGPLAWVIDANLDSPDGKVAVRIPLVKAGDSFMFREVMVESPYAGYVMEFRVNERLKEKFVQFAPWDESGDRI